MVILMKSNYKNGKREGKYIENYENGNIYEKCYYKTAKEKYYYKK
jgi:antitoxin component YwqK of YwqJK toxin-antitoxin module